MWRIPRQDTAALRALPKRSKQTQFVSSFCDSRTSWRSGAYGYYTWKISLFSWYKYPAKPAKPCSDNRDNILHVVIHKRDKKGKPAKDIQKWRTETGNIIKYLLNNAKEQNKDKVYQLCSKVGSMGMTPLQLAIYYGAYGAVEAVSRFTGVHRLETDARYIKGREIYDVSEIETLSHDKDIKKMKMNEMSGLRLLRMSKNRLGAYQIAVLLTFSAVIKSKWRNYRKLWMGWFCLHFLLMTLYTVSTHLRSTFTDGTQYWRSKPENDTGVQPLRPRPVCALANCGDFLEFNFLMQAVMCCMLWSYSSSPSAFSGRLFDGPSRPSKELTTVKKHFGFRARFRHSVNDLVLTVVLIALFGITIFASVFVKLFAYEYDEICISFILVIGWNLLLYLSRGTGKNMSYYCEMFNQTMTAEILHFLCFYFFVFIGFSNAITISFQPSEDFPPAFNNIMDSLYTLLKLTMGLTDIEDAVARYPSLVYVLTILYLLITYMMLLNMLIAIISDLFQANNKFKIGMFKIQNIAMITFIEDRLPQRWNMGWMCDLIHRNKPLREKKDNKKWAYM